jgi:hypothetical protein
MILFRCLFPFALYDNPNVSFRNQLQILIWGVNGKFHVIIQLLSIEAMMGTENGEDLYQNVTNS